MSDKHTPVSIFVIEGSMGYPKLCWRCSFLENAAVYCDQDANCTKCKIRKVSADCWKKAEKYYKYKYENTQKENEH